MKKPRPNHPYKSEIWQRSPDGEKTPISLAMWQQMNAMLCTEAAKKVRKSGPPEGGIGVKNWLQHTHAGSEEASKLPANERFGHVVLRFSTISAQEWFRPLIDMVLGKDNTGGEVHLMQEVDLDDDRARYTATVPLLEHETFGDNFPERDSFLFDIILYALGIKKNDPIRKGCSTFETRTYQSQDPNKPYQAAYSLGVKLPAELEAALDRIILGQRFGILPTALCAVKIFKQKKSMTPEERLARETAAMGIKQSVTEKSS